MEGREVTGPWCGLSGAPGRSRGAQREGSLGLKLSRAVWGLKRPGPVAPGPRGPLATFASRSLTALAVWPPCSYVSCLTHPQDPGRAGRGLKREDPLPFPTCSALCGCNLPSRARKGSLKAEHPCAPPSVAVLPQPSQGRGPSARLQWVRGLPRMPPGKEPPPASTPAPSRTSPTLDRVPPLRHPGTPLAAVRANQSGGGHRHA